MTSTTTFTATAATGETFTRRSVLELTHAVITVKAERAVIIAHHTAWLAKWGETGEVALIKTARKALAAAEAHDSRFIHTVRSWHTSEAAAVKARRIGETVVAVTS